MKETLRDIWETYRPSIRKFFINWNELLTIPIGFILWYYSPTLLYLVDPTASVYDAGIFQVVLFAVIGTLIISGVNWLIIKLSFPRIYRYIDNHLEEDLCSNSTAQSRLYFSLAFYFGHFLMMILLANAMPVV